jgi:hypothetical protein
MADWVWQREVTSSRSDQTQIKLTMPILAGDEIKNLPIGPGFGEYVVRIQPISNRHCIHPNNGLSFLPGAPVDYFAIPKIRRF